MKRESPTAPEEPAARRARPADTVTADALTRQCAAAGRWCVSAALALIALVGGLYLSGLLPSRRSLERAAAVWRLSAADAAAALDAAPDRSPAAGGWDGYRWAETTLLLLQAPVALWLLLLALDAARRRDALTVGMTAALLLVWLTAALGGSGSAAQ